MNKEKKARLKRRNGITLAVKVLVFALVMAVMAFTGLLWFLRPDTSTVEKRTLTEFPTLTWSSFWDGSFFSDVDTWYADTYPMRERLISGAQTLEGWYGIRGDQIVGEGGVAEAIPESATVSDSAEETEAEASPTPSPTPTPEPEEELEDGTVTESGEMAGTIYITQNCAYPLYYFLQDGADSYISTMNEIYDNIGDKVNMYTMICPTATSVMLDQTILDSLGCSNEGDAIKYMNSGLNEGIHALDIYPNLKKHNASYIYFHTDHHWTALGAYYAYQVFCEEKGIEPHDYEDYETLEFDNFMGTLYSSSENSPELAANPDTVIAYIPKGTNTMYMNLQDGRRNIAWSIVNDVSDYPSSEFYGTFSGGDKSFSYAHNQELDDGSAVLLIKDSYGNSFLPWLVDHYEYIYWIDYRYAEDTVLDMVNFYGVQDVIFECQIFNSTSDTWQASYRSIGASAATGNVSESVLDYDDEDDADDAETTEKSTDSASAVDDAGADEA